MIAPFLRCRSLGLIAVGSLLLLVAMAPGPAFGGLTPQMSGTFRPEKTYDFAGIDQVSTFNGGLTLQIPLGMRYQSGAMGYGLTLSFNSAKWQYRRGSGACGVNCIQESRLALRQNAGAGWSVSLGGLILPEPGSGFPWNPTGELVYFDALGGEHTLFEKLHPGDLDDASDPNPAEQRILYSKDGALLRVTKNAVSSPTLVTVSFGDGSRHLFNQVANQGWSGPTEPWLPARIENAYGDGISVRYLLDDALDPRWEIEDDFGRIQEVAFTTAGGTPAMQWLVSEVRLLNTTPGQSSKWRFEYGLQTLNKPWPNVGPTETVDAPVLTALILPDDTRYSIAAADYDVFGNPHRVVLPTLGEIHYEWRDVFLPPTVAPTVPCEPDLDPYMDLGEPHQNMGVRQRIVYNRQNVKSSLAVGLVELGRTQYCWTPIPLGGPGCYDDDLYEEMRQTTLDADGTRTESYFSVYNAHTALVRAPVWGTSLYEYGLPYIRDPQRDDPFNEGLFLSTEISQCNPPDPNLDPLAACTVVAQNCGPAMRRTYVAYEQDVSGTNPDLPPPQSDRRGYWSSQNRRLSGQRTVFLDDCTGSAELTCAWTKEAWSDYDRFGHFRSKVSTSSFASGTRTETTEYNASGPVAPFPWPETSPWVLGTSSFRETEQTLVVPCSGVAGSWGFPITQTTREESCFDPDTGFLKATRLRASPTGAVSPNDLVHRFVDTSAAADGLPDLEAWYGGDNGAAPTGDLCEDATFAGVMTSFAQEHGYSRGVLASTRWLTSTLTPVPFFTLRQEIDLATGLPVKVHDSADLGSTLFTDLEYDSSFRLKEVKPSAASGLAWESIAYVNATDTSLAEVVQTDCANGSTCAGSESLLQRSWQFDGFGRVNRELQRYGVGASEWDSRFTWYDGEGRKTYTSEWGRDGQTADYGTEFLYDFAGRVIETNHQTATVGSPGFDQTYWAYRGAREVERTTSIGTQIAGSSVTQSNVTTRETYDGFGRLVKVEEPSGDNLTSLVPTSYHYDIGSRLIGSMTEPLDATPDQQRCWTYNARGFLTSERHPELGASGQGVTTYSQYDALGNAREKDTGAHVVSFVFDRANRLTTVSEGPLALPVRSLKSFFYAIDNEAGNWRLGKVQVANAWNYPPNGANPEPETRLEETFVYGGVGGRKSERTLKFFLGPGALAAFHAPQQDLQVFHHAESYDALGQRVGLSYPQCVAGSRECPVSTTMPARSQSWVYELGRLRDVPGWTMPHLTQPGVVYHPGGMWAEIRHVNGVTDVQDQDASRRLRPGSLATVRGSQLLWKPGDFGYDSAGNILSIGASEDGGKDLFAYDGASRLRASRFFVQQRNPLDTDLLVDGFETGDDSHWNRTQHWETSVDLGYSFDEHGNLLQEDRTGLPPRVHETDGATNRLTSGVYDAAGNQTAHADVTTTFDALNRVARRQPSGGTPIYFLYTADDERTVIWDPELGSPAWLRFTLRDFDGKLVRKVNDTSSTSLVADEDFIFRGDQPLAKVGSYDDLAGVHLSLDHLGSVRTTTDASGTIVARKKFYPFGEEATPFFEQSAIALKYTGHERDAYDPASNGDDRDYMHARFASPITGRFLSIDPVMQVGRSQGTPQLWNRYAYAVGNPLSYVDPTGAAINLASMSEQERKELMDQLSATTGLILDYDSESGTVQILGKIADESGGTAGSATAREDLTSAIEHTKTFYGIARNDSDKVNMGERVGVHLNLDFSDIAKIDTGKNPSATFNTGMIFLHELKHAQGLKDPAKGMLARLHSIRGETVDHMNRIRVELGLPLRGQYRTEVDGQGRHYIPFTNGPVYVPGGVK